MASTIALFEVNPLLDRRQLAAEFDERKRLQIRDVLTEQTANTLRRILEYETPWGLGWQAAMDGPHSVRRDQLTAMAPKDREEIQRKLIAAVQGRDYAFAYMQYHLLEAYLGKWNPGGVHDLLLEHINDEPFMDLVRDVTGIPELVKADGQATLYGPNQFLSLHDDSHVAEGWQVAYVLNLANTDWRPEWGGYLMFYDEEGDVVQGFKPRFNALNLFKVPQRHNVSYVPPFAPYGRYAITGWFRDR